MCATRAPAANIKVFDPAVQPLVDQAITQQAQMIAYLNDFKLMLIATLFVILLLLLIRPAAKPADGAPAHAAAD
ncbi:hypothetical protein [Trinickia terrae]|uniref:hypothetical protein n=1 Tax=Trinickia terrae TaxID=2571161 RepID=UPI00268846AF